MALLPTGQQFRIRHDSQAATLVELGAGLREYLVGDRHVLQGYPETAPVSASRGVPLLPWPNRVEDGRYTFDGEEHQLPIEKVAEHNAIHGLTRWVNWVPRRHSVDEVVLGTTLFPRPGYPFTLSLEVGYRLTDAGLQVTFHARNDGTRALPYAAGHHPYFAVPGDRAADAVLHVPANRASVFGARSLPEPWFDVAGTSYDFRQPRKIGDRPIMVAYAGLARDGDGLARVRVNDVTVWMDAAFDYALVYTGLDLPNPADRHRSVAVEPMTAPANALRTGESLVVLQPGDTHAARFGIQVAA